MPIKKKIYYHDTDCGGVVYNANYLKYLEEARTEYYAEHGLIMKDMIHQGTFFVVARQEIDYKAPAHYGDILEIKTWPAEMSSARIDFLAEIKNQDGKLISQSKTILVCVGKDFKPKKIPEEIRAKIKVKQS